MMLVARVYVFAVGASSGREGGSEGSARLSGGLTEAGLLPQFPSCDRYNRASQVVDDDGGGGRLSAASGRDTDEWRVCVCLSVAGRVRRDVS